MTDTDPAERDVDLEELTATFKRFCDAEENAGRRNRVAMARTKFSEVVFLLRQDRDARDMGGR
jgi:hypothetical protein